jgi:hypothetical protein
VKGREAIFWQAVYVEFLGVFTPEGGGDPVFESEQKFYGNRGIDRQVDREE